jgi:hypothetical protein
MPLGGSNLVVKDVYTFYNDYIKPIYSEVEARGNVIPVELLFEIHSCFDHLKRYYLSEDSEEHACEKAISHLERGVLDGFKLKLKYFNTDLEKIDRSGADLRLIDSGDYIGRFFKAKSEIIECAKKARISESKKDKKIAFDNWTETSLKIDEFYKYFFDDAKLGWAKKQTIRVFSLNTLIGFALGVISSAIVAIIFFLIKK